MKSKTEIEKQEYIKLLKKQKEEGLKALDFYKIKHHGELTKENLKELEQARLKPSKAMKQYAYKLHENISPPIGNPKTDPYAPPGPDSKLWIGGVYKL